MSCPIDPNVNAGPGAHIGVTYFPARIPIVRFTPLTREGRKILKLADGETRWSTTPERGYVIYDAIVASGYSVKEEILSDWDDASKWEKTAQSLQQDAWNYR